MSNLCCVKEASGIKDLRVLTLLNCKLHVATIKIDALHPKAAKIDRKKFMYTSITELYGDDF